MLRTQRNAWIHLAATVVVLLSAAWLHLQRGDWLWLIVAIGWVWIAEALNTAMECLGDAVSKESNTWIGTAKDVAAGGVLIAAVGAAVMGGLVFYPYLGQKTSQPGIALGDVGGTESEAALFTAKKRTPVCASVRFWTPGRMADHLQQRESARKEIHDVLIRFGGGYTVWDVSGGWRNPQTNEVETESGQMYEAFAVDCSVPKAQENTISEIRRLLTSRFGFGQQAVFISTTGFSNTFKEREKNE